MAFYFISSYFDGSRSTHIMVLQPSYQAAVAANSDCCFLRLYFFLRSSLFLKPTSRKAAKAYFRGSAKYVKDKKAEPLQHKFSLKWFNSTMGSRDLLDLTSSHRIIRYNFCLIIYAREAGCWYTSGILIPTGIVSIVSICC